MANVAEQRHDGPDPLEVFVGGPDEDVEGAVGGLRAPAPDRPLTAIGLFALRAKRPTAERLVKSLGYPWLPGLYVVATALIAVDLLVNHVTRTYSLLGLALVLLGVPVYIIWRRLVP